MPTYAAPPTFTAGATLTAAQAQTISDDITCLAGLPVARKYRSAALTTVNGTATTIAFDGSSTGFYDSHSGFSGGTYTIPLAGYYRFTGGFLVAPTAAGQRLYLAVFKNGSEISRGDDFLSEASGFAGAVISDANLFAAGDTVTWRYFTGAALTAQVGASTIYGSISMERYP